MDFSKFDSWVKVPPRTYKDYEDQRGAWDGITESYHSQVSRIRITELAGSEAHIRDIGITFVAQIDAMDVFRLCYAPSPDNYDLNNAYDEDDAAPEIKYCAACFSAPEKRILGYFIDQREAFEACDEAAKRIAEEVEEALRHNRPSLYFSTYFLTNNYWPFGGERPEGDTGGIYTFEYAPKEEKKEESNKVEVPIEEEPKTFMDILCEMDSPASLDYYELKAALVRGVCGHIKVEECGVSSSDDDPPKHCGFFVDEEMFKEALNNAYDDFLTANCEDADSCYLILRGMQTDNLEAKDIHICAEEAVRGWVSADEIRIDVLRYVYSELGKSLP